MSRRNPQSRFSRARAVLVGLLALCLVALYGYHHRAEIGQIFDELRAAIPLTALIEAALPGMGLESDCPQNPGTQNAARVTGRR